MGWKFWRKTAPNLPAPVPDVSRDPLYGLGDAENVQYLIPGLHFDKVEPLDLMKVSFKASPNKSKRNGEIKYIVLHHTGPGSFNGVVNWLCNPDAKVSAHYVLGKQGELKQLVNSKQKAWHAGVSSWNGLNNINEYSIGIEICNIGRMEKVEDDYYYERGRNLVKYTGKTEPVWGQIVLPTGVSVEGYYVPYPEKQLNKLVALCKGLVEKYPQIGRNDIITHYDIGQPVGRKNDPFGLSINLVRDMIFY